MSLKEKIIEFARKRSKFTVADFIKFNELKVTRPYVSRLFSELVSEGKLLRAGESYRTFYSLPSKIKSLGDEIRLKVKIDGFDEQDILDRIKIKAPFILRLRENVRGLFEYAFSEMLNNAFEHSRSKYVEVEVSKKDHYLNFEVLDHGVGVFKNVMGKRKLSSPLEAMQDLLKGKTTTAPKAHSGEGIFFTSKAADVFSLDSYGYKMAVNNIIDDIFIGRSPKSIRGTYVHFSVNLNSKKHPIDIFGKFQTSKNEFGFDKTEILVKLYTIGTIYVSRSQARRILEGLNKFKTVILDFDSVPMIGQAFADEVFRVFKNKYPHISIIPINMNDAVEFMIRRVGKL